MIKKGIVVLLIFCCILFISGCREIPIEEEQYQETQEEKDWCYILTSLDGIKYCSDIQGDHFDYCDGQEYYTWYCSTKEDVEQKRTLHENICISKRIICPENYYCQPRVSAISCYKIS